MIDTKQGLNEQIDRVIAVTDNEDLMEVVNNLEAITDDLEEAINALSDSRPTLDEKGKEALNLLDDVFKRLYA